MKMIPLLIALCQFAAAQSIDSLGMSVRGAGRQFVFTNKEAGTFHGEVNDVNSGGWQGWFVNAEKIMHDYAVLVNDTLLDRTSARSTVYPHQLIRRYPNGIRETVTLLDSVDVLVVEITDPSAQLVLKPVDAFRPDTLTRSPVMRWIRTNSAPEFVPTELLVVRSLQRRSTVFAIAAGRSGESLRSLARLASIDPGFFSAKRKERMQALLDRSAVRFDNRDLTVALAWAKLQVDALIMNQSTGGARTKGIFAGLPWFNNYWGRDSFISLPGATYVMGNMEDAREILRSYAAFQETGPTSPNYGRIPNLATPQSVIYNTADGTPWFVRALEEYVRYSGDTAFIREMYPVVVRSIEGTLLHHSDSLGFLTHADAESWMDAVGPDGPWSPRGNRANDVQALWSEQLRIGISAAQQFGDTSSAVRWMDVRERLHRNFSACFIDTAAGAIHDHLHADGTPSAELRPNQLFALSMPMPEQVRRSAVRAVLSELVYPYGTATLAQSDPNFHPHHEFPPYYVKDAAYHNGTVWTWLNGAAVSAAVRYGLQDLLFPVTMDNVHQMLRRGTVGALSELLDAHPRKPGTEPRLSGTYSQAWSSAEFIRSIHQEYLGLTVDLTARKLRLAPMLPTSLHFAAVSQRVDTGSLRITYQRTKSGIVTTLHASGLSSPVEIEYVWRYADGTIITSPVTVEQNTRVTLAHTKTSLTVTEGKNVTRFDSKEKKTFSSTPAPSSSFAGLRLATPDVHREFPVLRGPSHPLLTHRQATAKNPGAALLAEGTDPRGDDTGLSGTYRYPSSHHFAPGILDITGASFRYDSVNLYVQLTFAALADPGWHPEYGFQLTLAAIALNTGSGTQRAVPANARYILPPGRAFDRLILVGGGVRVLNDSGTILCEYIPRQEDAAAPIGSVTERSVRFSVPLSYLGTPSQTWKFTLLIGGQDDHGGAGIGEFRTVQYEGSEWLGGGKQEANESNVYDVMELH